MTDNIEQILKTLDERNSARHQSLAILLMNLGGISQDIAHAMATELDKAIKSDFPVEAWDE